MDQIIRCVIDTSKHVFQLHGVNGAEQPVLRKKLRRIEMVDFCTKCSPTVIGIEACGASHHWARLLTSLGHEVKLIAPQFVKPYLKRGKNDAADAEAICEAMSRPTMRFVPVKSEDEQAALMLVNMRDRLVRVQTQLVNAIRGHAAEFGMAAAKGLAHVRPLLQRIAEYKTLPAMARDLFDFMAGEFERLQEQIARVDGKIQAWHLMNQIRSLLLERGHIVPQGRAKLAVRLGEMLDGDEPVLGHRIHRLVSDLRLRWIALDERIADLDAEFTEAARADERTRRLLTIPGIGALNATALVAAVGDARTFVRGRDLAAWLGLVPRQATTGGKPRLLDITKRGSRYLRKNLIQGARASLPTMSKSDTRLGAWLRSLFARSHPNTVVVALAAKMARIVWALLRHGCNYEPVAQAA